jgi:hypothetical protein
MRLEDKDVAIAKALIPRTRLMKPELQIKVDWICIIFWLTNDDWLLDL